MYLQQRKYDQALHLFRILRLHTSKNLKIALALSYCLLKARRLEEALKVLKTIEEKALSNDQRTAFYYIYSKVLWDLKQLDASREMLHNYLRNRKLNA